MFFTYVNLTCQVASIIKRKKVNLTRGLLHQGGIQKMKQVMWPLMATISTRYDSIKKRTYSLRYMKNQSNTGCDTF